MEYKDNFKELVQKVIELSEVATLQATEKHGHLVDNHQAFSVLLEELIELEQELVDDKTLTKFAIDSLFTKAIMRDDNGIIMECLKIISKRLVLGIAEGLQAIAVCNRWSEMLQDKKRNY